MQRGGTLILQQAWHVFGEAGSGVSYEGTSWRDRETVVEDPPPSSERRRNPWFDGVTIDMCAECFTKFPKLPDHPKRDGIARCPHCLAKGLDAERLTTEELRRELASRADPTCQ